MNDSKWATEDLFDAKSCQNFLVLFVSLKVCQALMNFLILKKSELFINKNLVFNKKVNFYTQQASKLIRIFKQCEFLKFFNLQNGHRCLAHPISLFYLSFFSWWRHFLLPTSKYWDEESLLIPSRINGWRNLEHWNEKSWLFNVSSEWKFPNLLY